MICKLLRTSSITGRSGGLSRRKGFTLVEFLVASLVALMFLVIAYQAFIGLARSQKSSDRRASRALLEAQILELLLLDVRSSKMPPPLSGLALGPAAATTKAEGQGRVTIHRKVWDGSTFRDDTVTWRTEGGVRILREVKGKATHRFDFTNLRGPDLERVSLDVVPVNDAEMFTFRPN